MKYRKIFVSIVFLALAMAATPSFSANLEFAKSEESFSGQTKALTEQIEKLDNEKAYAQYFDMVHAYVKIFEKDGHLTPMSISRAVYRYFPNLNIDQAHRLAIYAHAVTGYSLGQYGDLVDYIGGKKKFQKIIRKVDNISFFLDMNYQLFLAKAKLNKECVRK